MLHAHSFGTARDLDSDDGLSFLFFEIIVTW
jgi:hypothetical protein